MLPVLKAIFWGLVVLSFLVTIHEWGHFIAARICGMRVTEFFIGMPSRIQLSYASKKKGTRFGVTPILLGGYTKICGMATETDELMPKAFQTIQEKGKLSVSELASALSIDAERAEKLLESLADWGSISSAFEEQNVPADANPYDHIYYKTLARDANFKTIYDKNHDFETEGSSADGEVRPVKDSELAQLMEAEKHATYSGRGFFQRVFVLILGPLVNIIFAIVVIFCSLHFVGVQMVSNSNTIASVQRESLAENAGISAGDTITKINDTNVYTWTDITDNLSKVLKNKQDFRVTYEHKSEAFEVLVPYSTSNDSTFGVVAATYTYKLSLSEAAASTLNYIKMVADFAASLLVPTKTLAVLQQTSSVVGISQAASQAASSGILDFFMFVAAVSASLGVMNLLPIPPLDGGKILIECIQGISRKDLPIVWQNRIAYIGIAFFLFLFAFALKNDIVRIFFS